MSLGRTYAVALMGLDGSLIEVEADIGQSLPNFVILGLPDASLNESRDRIRAAAKNAGIPLSARKITVNLIPASLPKRGSGFDLAILMAALRANGDIRDTGPTVFLSEVGLDGRLRPVRGVLPAVIAAVAAGHLDVVVARENLAEAELVPGVRVLGFASVAATLLHFGAKPKKLIMPALERLAPGVDVSRSLGEPRRLDMADIAGQAEPRFAVEIAAAGAHHLMMMGPPGAGKTMLAERLPGILPDLSDSHAMEATAIHSISGAAASCTELLRRPPFENPHHSATPAAIIGGGSGIPRPGAASRAHRGVLFLDEAPEYERRVLDALRQPLESGSLVLHRAVGTASYPARFQLVLAANPCPCGLASGKGVDCTCTAQQRRRYFGRISGPLLDRVDLQLTVQRVSMADYSTSTDAESTATVASRISQARAAQRERLRSWGLWTNSEVPGTLLKKELKLPESVLRPLNEAMRRETITARGYDRVLKVAWTMGDLRGLAMPGADEILEAQQLRQQVVSS